MVKIQFSTVSCLFCTTTIASGIIHSAVSLTRVIIANRFYILFFPFFSFTTSFSTSPCLPLLQTSPPSSLFICSFCFHVHFFSLAFFSFLYVKESTKGEFTDRKFGQRFDLCHKDLPFAVLHIIRRKSCPT